jgi:hypothetical protein
MLCNEENAPYSNGPSHKSRACLCIIHLAQVVMCAGCFQDQATRPRERLAEFLHTLSASPHQRTSRHITARNVFCMIRSGRLSDITSTHSERAVLSAFHFDQLHWNNRLSTCLAFSVFRLHTLRLHLYSSMGNS